MLTPRFIARSRPIRAGFTLVEMMVAMALSLGIMLILTEAFRISLDFVRSANSTGIMIAQLNGVGNTFKQDFQYEFFLSDDNKPNGGVKLSDQPAGTSPSGGYFQIVNTPAITSVNDQDGILVNTANHSIQFTAVLPGGTDQNQFTLTSFNGNIYTSRAAIISYFLVPSGTTSPGGSQLFTMYRHVRLIAVSSDDLTSLAIKPGDNNAAPGGGTYYSEVVVAQSATGYTTPHYLQSLNSAPVDRSPPNGIYYPPGSARFGDDILASNVLSFEALPWWDGNSSSRQFPASSDGPYDNLSSVTNPVFDTGSAGPPTIRVKGLQITVRVYDPRMKQARQNTWKFAM
jgi:prepilin-type N-terminal cleavage/methylation domain-containing protein